MLRTGFERYPGATADGASHLPMFSMRSHLSGMEWWRREKKGFFSTKEGVVLGSILTLKVTLPAVQKNCSLTQKLDGEKDHALATIQSPCCHFSFLSIETDTRKNTGKCVCVCERKKEFGKASSVLFSWASESTQLRKTETSMVRTSHYPILCPSACCIPLD